MAKPRYNLKIFPLGAAFLWLAWMSAAEEPRKTPHLEKPEIFEYDFLDINRINCTIASDGPYADSRRTSAAGFEWPKRSGKTALFTAGIWIVGIHRPTDSLRTANMDYSTEYQPGPLLETFNTTTNNDAGPRGRAGDPRYRLYKILRGDTLSPDYLEWPVDLGAPCEDLNENGLWDPGIDRPKFYGDQQIWCVINDVNVGLHLRLGATPPMGLEIRILYYAFARTDVLGNTMFMRWEIINKSDAAYDSVFFSMWSDPDMGDANDDLPGCDTTLNLGYVYNGDNDDGTAAGYGARPPALGFVYLEGPALQGIPEDSGRIMTSFVPFTGGTFAELIDPPDASPNYARIAYDFLKGMMGTVGRYLMRPDSSIITYYLSGDPVTGTGDLPSNFPLWGGKFYPQDIRMSINSGPFTLAVGDTQMVVSALLLSQGDDRLGSLALLRQDVRFVQAYHAAPTDSLPGRFIAVSPARLGFGHTEVGAGGDTLGVVLMNYGREAMQITGIEYPAAPDFTPVDALSFPLSLQTYETANIAIRFTPTGRGSFGDYLVIHTDDPVQGRISVPVTGNGYTMFPALPTLIYGISSSYDLYTIDPGTGTVNAIGSAGRFGISSLAIHPTSHTLLGFRVVNSTSSRMYQLCTQNSDVLEAGGAETRVRGFGFSSEDTIYAAAEDGSLHRLSYPVWGDTRLGTTDGVSYTALAVHPTTGELWAAARGALLGTRLDQIYKVDNLTGMGTFLGYTGDSVTTSSLAFDADGLLYGLKRAGQRTYLVHIDTLTGEGSVVLKLGEYNLTAMAMRSDSLRVVSVEDEEIALPEEYALQQNFPNPFNPATTIEFALPQSSDVSLRVFNVLGEEVASLIDREMDAGVHRVMWDASGMASGVYLYRLSAGNYVMTRKLILIR
ncbi:MAG: T9SS type A sorting domain-containing protein [Bacteroidota bacterium]